MSSVLRVESVGRRISRSLTSTAISEITYSKRVFSAVIPLVLNWASTWANQKMGSVGQKGGNFRLTAEIVEVVAPVTGTGG